MHLRFGPLALAAVVVACDVPPTGAIDAGSGDAAAPAATGMLLLESASPITLAPGEHADVVARWLDADGAPVAFREATFGLEGMPRDSTLRALVARTDGEGRVTGTVLAGMLPATFRVRVAAPEARPVYVDVAVGAEGFGAILVEMPNLEARTIARREVFLHQGAIPCPDASARLESDRARTLPDGDDRIEIRALPAGQSFTVVGRGFGPRGALVASGCVAGVIVPRDSTIRAVIDMMPEPLAVGGEYAAVADLAPGAVAVDAADAIAEAVLAASAAAGGDAALLLGALDAELRGRGETGAADALADERATGDADAELARSLSDARSGPSVALADALASIAPRLSSIGISGTLAVTSDTAGVAGTFLRALVLLDPASREPIGLDLAARGIEPRSRIGLRWLAEGDRIEIDVLPIALPLGQIALAAVAGRARAAEGPIDALLPSSGCDVLAAFVAARSALSTVCDDGCVLDACKSAVEGALALAQGAAATIDGRLGEVQIRGTLGCADVDGDLAVDALRPEAIEADWVSADGANRTAVAASLRGTRIEPVP